MDILRSYRSQFEASFFITLNILVSILNSILQEWNKSIHIIIFTAKKTQLRDILAFGGKDNQKLLIFALNRLLFLFQTSNREEVLHFGIELATPRS